MTLAVLGNGSSGRAAAALAARRGYGTVTLDGDDAFPRDARFCGAVVSPGIPFDHPWQAACRAAGIPLKSELQFGCEELRRQGVRLLAVTGSKGKSSVVKIVADALTRAGRRAVPCGNYGRPVCDVALEGWKNEDARRETRGARIGTEDAGRCAWAVVEVSSFQLETTELPPDAFVAAVILNLQEDHLDRHGSVEVYHALKRKLLGMTRSPLDCSQPSTSNLQPSTFNLQPPTFNLQPPTFNLQPRTFNLQPSTSNLFTGSYFDNEILRTNGAAAVFLLRAAGLDDAAIADAFRAFEPLPHRMNTVGVFGGVTCIDDSKATSLAALAAGVRMACSSPPVIQSNNPTSQESAAVAKSAPTCGRGALAASDAERSSNVDATRASRPRGIATASSNNPPPRIRLIAGGLPKGDDPKSVLGDLTARVKKVYLIGQSAELFSAAWSGAVACENCGTMDRAVEAAMREAESGETVLLSPGTASFDQFHSFGERGDVFANLVQQQGKNK